MSAQEYRGHTIDADTNLEGEWVPLVDGDERGRPQRSRADALRAARSSVNRSLGREHPAERPASAELVDDAFWRGLRELIR